MIELRGGAPSSWPTPKRWPTGVISAVTTPKCAGTACTTEALGLPLADVRPARRVATLSGGEQKRLVLQFLLTGPADVLLLDEPDNYLDVPSKRWLESRLAEIRKTVLLVSHDRELLRQAATRIVTLEPSAAGCFGLGAWRRLCDVPRARETPARLAWRSSASDGTRSSHG